MIIQSSNTEAVYKWKRSYAIFPIIIGFNDKKYFVWFKKYYFLEEKKYWTNYGGGAGKDIKDTIKNFYYFKLQVDIEKLTSPDEADRELEILKVRTLKYLGENDENSNSDNY